MAMDVRNNMSAIKSLNRLNKNNDNLAKSLKKISSGVRITGAADDASGYSISEKMRVMIRGLDQDIQNVKNGTSLLGVASGGVQSIIDELRTLKELALNSANDHNTDADRATLQKEFDQRKEHIDNVAVETDYNGIILLDGRWGRKIKCTAEGTQKVVSRDVTSSTTTSPGTSTTVGPTTTTRIIPPTSNTTRTTEITTSTTMPSNTGITTTGPVTTTSTSSDTTTSEPTVTSSTGSTTSEFETTINGDYTTVTTTEKITRNITTATTTTQTNTTTTKNVTTTTIVSATPTTITTPNSPIIITNGTTAITEDGVYEFAPDYTGTLSISAQSVEIMGPSNGTTLNDVYIVDKGVNDLYLKNFSVVNTQDKSVIKFDYNTSNTLHLLGNNSIVAATQVNYQSDADATKKAVINAGGGLSIVGNGNLSIVQRPQSVGAIIGSDYKDFCGDINIGQQVSINIKKTCGGAGGAGIGSGGGIGALCGDISIGTGASVIVDMYEDPFFNQENREGRTAAAGIGSGNNTSVAGRPKCGDVVIYSGAKVSVKNGAGAGIGSSYSNSQCGDITIYSGALVDASSYWSAGIGSGGNYNSNFLSKCGDITVYSYSSGNVSAKSYNSNPWGWRPAEAEDIGVGNKSEPANSKVGVVQLLDTENITPGGIADFSDLSLGTTSTTSYEITTETITKTDTSMLIEESKTTQYDTSIETTETVTTTVYEEGEPVEWSNGNPLIIQTGTKANQQLRVFIEDMRLEALGISDTKINPLEEAVNSLEIIDNAIEYALDQATHLGAYVLELSFTNENLVTANENIQESESVIRDADMAKEMVGYVKNQVLSQASQSMLAQANQSLTQVLSLLQ